MLEVDSDLNKANAEGDFPLELAIQAGQDINSSIFENNKTNVPKDLIKKMLEKGANPNLTPSGKNSPLILAILKGLDSIVDLLLESGAVTSHIGGNKSTAFESCLQLNNSEFVFISYLVVVVSVLDGGKYRKAYQTISFYEVISHFVSVY